LSFALSELMIEALFDNSTGRSGAER